MKNPMAFIFRAALLCVLVGLTACATVPRERVFDAFVLVRTQEGDSLKSLAETYLKDAENDWQIAQFNGITVVSPGQDLIVPLRPFEWGGIRQNGCQGVPVLAYHRFSRKNKGSRTVCEAAFRAHMKFLKADGFRVISLDQLVDFFALQVQIPEKSIVITLDDGWRSAYEIAFPILKAHGYPATLFVRTDFVGKKNAMSWAQVGRLAKDGFDIQCKITRHQNVATLKDRDAFKTYFRTLQKEITRSKETIRNRINRECRYLAYASGRPHNIVIALAKKEGFRAAFTLERGGNPFFVNPHMVHRSVIHGRVDMGQFKKDLSVFIPETVGLSGQ